MYLLNYQELHRLREAVRAVYAIPFIDDIEDFIWEAIFSFVRGVPLVDPFEKTREKKLFDLVDPTSGRGWSAKTLDVGASCAPGKQFELVIQRANIFGKAESLGFPPLSIESPPSLLGEALVKHWTLKLNRDRELQGVQDARVCVLLKKRPIRERFIFYEDELHWYEPDALEWRWTDTNRRGLQAFRKKDGVRVYRWYRSGGQLFEIFQLPQSIVEFSVSTSRLPPERVIRVLSECFGSTL